MSEEAAAGEGAAAGAAGAARPAWRILSDLPLASGHPGESLQERRSRGTFMKGRVL